MAISIKHQIIVVFRRLVAGRECYLTNYSTHVLQVDEYNSYLAAEEFISHIAKIFE